MKALIVDETGKLSVEEIEKPDYGPCQALVKLESCGVCNGTDMKLIHGTFKNFLSYPAILGHEGVGRVVETGAQAEHLHVGDLVLLPFLEKETAGYTPGWGAYAEYAVVGDAQSYIRHGMGPGTPEWSEAYLAQTVLRPEDQVDAVGASMIITFREVLSAIRRFGCQPNETALVLGAGPVGLCFTRFLKLLGLRTVITTDIADAKVEEAKRMGADYSFNTAACDIGEEVKRLIPDGVDYVVDAVGINALINQAMPLVKYNGKICCYGISPKLNMELDWSQAPYNWTLQFVQWPSKKEEGEAHSQIMAWINQGVLKPMDFISHVIPFEQCLEAFKLVEARESGTKKIVIKF
ncbi:zinc-dependent alcohol dehydrogenase [Lacrimispora sp.]|uniref:zinc-dependent alcohol dehydrogenase n=1 Tax=Lacrimispora sp. TaxID=2719234 RepID=UPI0028A00735|nr:zinc-binding dehydrogenase [Lacrimispora sp.]